MSLSDCAKCWDTPCHCGYQYRDWSIESLESQILMLQKVLDDKRYLWRSTRDHLFSTDGFYVLRYTISNIPDRYVYANRPGKQGSTYSFWCTMPNFRDAGTIHDLGYCEWSNNTTLDKWRSMTHQEEMEFRTKLFRFDRLKH